MERFDVKAIRVELIGSCCFPCIRFAFAYVETIAPCCSEWKSARGKVHVDSFSSAKFEIQLKLVLCSLSKSTRKSIIPTNATWLLGMICVCCSSRRFSLIIIYLFFRIKYSVYTMQCHSWTDRLLNAHQNRIGVLGWVDVSLTREKKRQSQRQ